MPHLRRSAAIGSCTQPLRAGLNSDAPTALGCGFGACLHRRHGMGLGHSVRCAEGVPHLRRSPRLDTLSQAFRPGLTFGCPALRASTVPLCDPDYVCRAGFLATSLLKGECNDTSLLCLGSRHTAGPSTPLRFGRDDKSGSGAFVECRCWFLETHAPLGCMTNVSGSV